MSSERFGSIVLFCLALSLATPISSAESDSSYVPASGAGVVEVRRPSDAKGNDLDAIWQREIRTHAALMRQRLLYEQIVMNEGSEVRKTALFKDLNGLKMIEWMERNIRVQVVPGTSLIEISAAATDNPRDAQTIIREVTITYLDNVAERTFLKGQARAQHLTALRTKYRALYQETDARLSHLMKQVPEPEEKASWADSLERVRHQRSRLEEKLDRLQDELDELEAVQTQKITSDVAWVVFPTLPPPKASKEP
jgi:hypothetical protein